MKATVRVAVALLLVAAVSAHGHHHHDRRRLLQGNRGNGNGANKGASANNDRKGLKFNFPKGTARAFLDNVDQQQLQKVLEKAHFSDNSALAQALETEPDLGIYVGSNSAEVQGASTASSSAEVQLIYTCTGLAVPTDYVPTATAEGAAAAAATAASPTDADPAISNVWALSSRPSAINKIWLDFRGGTVRGTAWNDASLPSIVVPPYSTDADASLFSTTERSNIVAIWRGVAEDFSMFNVDVTTINPRAAGTPPQNYMRVLIGGSSSLLNMAAGGVAFVGLFGRSDTTYQPAFVFSDDLRKGFPKDVWEAVSHEVGHTMGLSHDGVKKADGSVDAYYGGINGWAPIMGASYYQPVSQWSQGEYQGANQKQDDLAIIAGKLSYAPSGNGNTLATASPLTPAVSASTATTTGIGIVSQTGAAEMFKLQANRGTLSFSVSVLNAWGRYGRANLDAAVKVLDASGNEVTSSQNTAGLAVTGTAVLSSAGTYYIAVSGSGSGDPLTTGYSSYGSLGQFSLQATYPEFTAPPTTLATPNPPPVSTSSPKTMTASIVRPIRKTLDSATNSYSCYALLKVSDASNIGLAGAAVVGTWTTSVTTRYSKSSGSTASALGLVRLAVKAPAAARSCTVKVTSVTLEGYTMQTDLASLTQTATW